MNVKRLRSHAVLLSRLLAPYAYLVSGSYAVNFGVEVGCDMYKRFVSLSGKFTEITEGLREIIEACDDELSVDDIPPGTVLMSLEFGEDGEIKE